MERHRFIDKVVVVTGAAGGIGREIVRTFSDERANIVLVDCKVHSMETIVRDLNLSDNKYLIIEADVSNEHEIENIVHQTVGKFGKIDVLCNNAGIVGKSSKIIDIDEVDIDAVFNVNVKGMFFGTKHVLKQMIKQKSGCIINTSSTLGLRGSRNMAVYSASKHAVIGLTKCTALEVADMGIRVNAVCPAPVETEMMNTIATNVFNNVSMEESMAMYAESIPMKRMAQPSEVANVIAFLASDEAAFITGSSYILDGGKTV